MTTVKTEIIERYITENSISKTEFCELCGINESVLQKILIGDNDFELIDLFRISRLLNLRISQLFNE